MSENKLFIMSSDHSINSSSSSSSSSDDEVQLLPRKRYKKYLYSNNAESQVTKRTRRRWASMQYESRSLQYTRAEISTDNIQVRPTNNDCTQDELGSLDARAGIGTDSIQPPSPTHDDRIQNEDELVGQFPNEQLLPRSSPQYNSNSAQFSEEFSSEKVINESNLNSSIENDYLDTDDDDICIQSEYSESSESNQTNSENDFDDSKDYSAFFNKEMFKESKLTVRDIVLMITAFALRFCLSDEGKLVLADMLKFCAGPNFKSLNLSKYIMSKCFSSQEENITYHHYCSQCTSVILNSSTANNKIKKQNIICEKCQKKNSIETRSSNYFVSINLAYQIKLLLSNRMLFDDILKNIRSRNAAVDNHTNNNIIRDVHDSELYKKSMQGNNKKFEYILTLNINTDGAPLTRSGKRAFWPVQATLNDLSPKLRFKYILLTGLLIAEKEPKSSLLNLYLSKVLVEQIDNLLTKGISVVIEGRKCIIKFRVHSAVVDSVCRPIVQNRIQFNGYSGCSWCYQLGLYIPDVHGIRYVFEQDSIIRTRETHEDDVKNAETGVIVRGVKGPSALSELDNFDMVWSFPYEYMHGLLLGVCHQLWNEWKNGVSEFKISKGNVENIEQRYLCIAPTHEIHRLPRKGILQGTSKPKASELKSWLLINSLPCLKGILHENAIDHYALLVKSAYTLLKSEISEEELNQCERDLLQFVAYYEMYYGCNSMTFNVHSVQHAVQSVRKTGPLYANSAFSFEGNIYYLKTYINGPKGMDRQMARKHMQRFIFKLGNTADLSSSKEVSEFCTDLFTPKRLKVYFETGLESLTFFGRSELIEVDGIGKCLMYKKCIFKDTVYHSIKYSRVKKTDDTAVELVSGEYGRIIDILKVENECFLHLHLFEVFPDYPFRNVSHIKQIKRLDSKNKHVISINNVRQKVILVNARHSRYLCTLPNTVEIQ